MLKISIEKNVTILPSVISMDLCNLESEIHRYQEHGFNKFHVDIIDKIFSPTMPVGISVIEQLVKKTNLCFDVHVMAVDNEFFVRKMLDIGAKKVCFHIEAERHIDRIVSVIKRNGAKAGLALNPATGIDCLKYIINEINYVLLMLINPGYADFQDECQVSYGKQKIADLNKMLTQNNANASIMVDGRISLDNIRQFSKLGVAEFVAGSTCLINNNDLEENIKKINGIF